MSALLLGVFGLFTVIVIESMLVTDLELHHLIIGFLSCATLISLFVCNGSKWYMNVSWNRASVHACENLNGSRA
uniref:Bidirectional sugar transporter SWEET2 n=1 Tax=Tanacetum cinerariifolium TaxID=118510 RepID=A0A6L2J964_TANCI|nr:bidirectional sugar transporter SWEET2 [Tanacetum cinerariifolium]